MADWLDAFDQTPTRPLSRESAWILAIVWLLFAVPLFWQAAQDVSARARLGEFAVPMLIAAALTVTSVWQPAFRIRVIARNKFASETARRWAHRLRWVALAVVAVLTGTAISREDWVGFLVGAMWQAAVASETFVRFVSGRRSLVDRVPVDSIRWAQRSARLVQAHVVCTLAMWTWFLLALSARTNAVDGWAILGVALAVALPTLGYLTRQIREIEEWRRCLLTILDEGITSVAGSTPDVSLASAMLRLESLVVAGPSTIGPATEPAILRIVVTLSVTLNAAVRAGGQALLTSQPARELAQLEPREQATLATELMGMLRSRLLYGGTPLSA